MVYITLENTCGKGVNTKVIDVDYLIIDAVSPYNIILRATNYQCSRSICVHTIPDLGVFFL